jgi:hypothetical protein
MGPASPLLLAVLCGLLFVNVQSTINAAHATSNLIKTAASLPSTDAPSIAWQNSTWNLAGEDSWCCWCLLTSAHRQLTFAYYACRTLPFTVSESIKVLYSSSSSSSSSDLALYPLPCFLDTCTHCDMAIQQPDFRKPPLHNLQYSSWHESKNFIVSM